MLLGDLRLVLTAAKPPVGRWSRRAPGYPLGTAVAIVVLCLLGLAGTASAQQSPLLQQAQTKYDQADFQGALSTLDQAEQTNGLTRDDLVRLLALRGLVHLGMRDDSALRRDMSRLASIDPHHSFATTAPPELPGAFDQAKQGLPGAMRIETHVVPTASGVAVQASVENDPLSLVRQVRVNARQGGEIFHTGVGSVELATTSPARVQYYVQAVGPGGAVLLSRGSAAAPLEAPAPMPTHPRTPHVSHGSPWLWIGIGGAAVIVVVGAILIGVLAGNDGSRSTQPSLPMRVPL